MRVTLKALMVVAGVLFSAGTSAGIDDPDFLLHTSDLSLREGVRRYKAEGGHIVTINGVKFLHDGTGIEAGHMQKIRYDWFPNCEGLSTRKIKDRPDILSEKENCFRDLQWKAEAAERRAKADAESAAREAAYKRQKEAEGPWMLLGFIAFFGFLFWGSMRNHTIWEARGKWAEDYLNKRR